MNSRKGISALIGTVLVLLVTISAVGLFSSWAPNLVQDVTDSTENQTKSQINCNKADLEIISTNYIAGERVTVVVRNTGTINLGDIRLEAWGSEVPINATTVEGPEPAGLITENISADSQPVSVNTVSTECSNAEDSVDDIS